MEDVQEIAPGLYALPDGIAICPGCGCMGCGLDPYSDGDVLDWCIAAFSVLRNLGVEWATDAQARRVARDFVRERWHDEH